MNDRTPGGTSPFNSMFYFLAGGVTGASVALLLAPQSGRATRERMRHKLSDTSGFGRALKDRLTRRSHQLRNAARLRANDAVSALTGDAGAKLPG